MDARLLTALLTSACLLTACTAPAGAAVTRCQSSGFSDHTCTLTVERFEKQTSATFRSSSANRGVDIQASFTVRTGTALIQIHGSDGPAGEATVSPDNPAELTVATVLKMGSRTRDEDPSFSIRIIPTGVVEGLSGDIAYQTRPRG